jgi:hypothetical protein
LLALLVLAVAYSGTGSYQGSQTSVNGDSGISRLTTGRRGTWVGRLGVNGYGQNNGQGGESVFHMNNRKKIRLRLFDCTTLQKCGEKFKRTNKTQFRTPTKPLHNQRNSFEMGL